MNWIKEGFFRLLYGTPRIEPSLVKRTNPRDSQGRPTYLSRLAIWKRYPRLFILGGGSLLGSVMWIYPLYQALFFTPEDIPYQADWWPSEKAAGKRIVEQYRERQAKIEFYRLHYEKERAEKEAAKAQLAKVVLK